MSLSENPCIFCPYKYACYGKCPKKVEYDKETLKIGVIYWADNTGESK